MNKADVKRSGQLQVGVNDDDSILLPKAGSMVTTGLMGGRINFETVRRKINSEASITSSSAFR